MPEYVLRTRRGTFRMCLARGKGALHCLDRELSRVLWFFFDQRLAMREPEAIKVALEFRRELDSRQDDRHGSYSLEELRRQIESQLWFGHIGFVEVVPPFSSPRRPNETPPRTIAASPSRQDDPTWFELTLVDEVGQGIGGQDVQLSVSGKQVKQPTDGGGTVRLDDVRSATSFANARLPDVADLKAALKPRWDTIRADRILTEDDATLVFLRGQSLDAVSLESETPKLVSIQPYVEQARLLGMFFDTNKNFLLPGAIPSLRNIKRLYDRNPTSTLLVVGHTDTSGEPSYNDPLSLERAESVAQYLTDDVAAWLKRYGEGVTPKKRWGEAEDLLMIEALGLQGPQLETPIDRVGQSPVAWYQKWHNKLQGKQRAANWELLSEDAKIGPKTRRQLIGDYMNFDETTLPEGIKLLTHGCGENFPLERVEALDPDVSDAMDRRVELFFFDADLGIQPPAPGKHSKPGSLEYPEWCRRARRVHDFLSHANGPLCVTVDAEEDDETLRLLVMSGAGAPVRVLSAEEGSRDGDTVSFSFLPEFLPPTVQFQVERDGELEEVSPALSPTALRDDLFTGDTDSAADKVSKSPDGVDTGDDWEPRDEEAPRPVSVRLVGSAPSKGKQAQSHSLTFAVFWGNKKHRFLREMRVWVTANAGATLKETKTVLGERRFEVLPGIDAFVLHMRIVAPNTGVTVLDLEQEFKVLRPTGDRIGIERVKSNVRQLKRHPRIAALGYRAGAKSETVCAVDVDLTFLDVTKHLQALGRGEGRFQTFLDYKDDIRSKVVVLECTQRGGPSAWPVIIAPALSRSSPTLGALLFFKNEALERVENDVVVEGVYNNADDANYVKAVGAYFNNPKNQGQYFDPFGGREYHNYPSLGWDKQLRDSGKPIVVFLPIPHGTSFGTFNHPKLFHKKMLKKSATLALFAEQRVGQKRGRRPRMKRVAMGGWSSGTNTLFKWAAVSEASNFVDELYMFDGTDVSKIDAPGILKAWFDHDPQRRRLRVIGTAYTEDAANRLNALLKHPHVFVYPGDPRYWYDSPDYKRALTASGVPPLEFRATPDDPSPANDASVTNLYLKKEKLTVVKQGIRVSQSITLYTPGVRVTKTISHMSKEEAALLVVKGVPTKLARATTPVRTAAQFVKLTGWLEQDPDPDSGERNRSHRHRHPWSVFGGATQNGVFVGYFQMCLKESGF